MPVGHYEKIEMCRTMRSSSTKTRKADSGQRFPALPGCYSQGETVDELKHSIREAIAGVLDVLRERDVSRTPNIQILDVAV